jgi:prepilin-type N-terminal cleavage/methylation domain-containing protein
MSHQLRRRQDEGFTLIEVLIVVTLMGLVMTTLAAAFVVIIRVVPSNDHRVDDARSTRALQSYLSHDVGSTPSYEPVNSTYGGFNFAPSADPCATGVGANAVELRWKETIGTSTREWIVNYRVQPLGGSSKYQIVRYTCGAGGATTTPLTTGILNNAPCGTVGSRNSGFAKATPSSGQVTDLRMCMTVSSDSGSNLVLVDVASRNPSEAFP